MIQTIVLLPVKNESWILRSSLENFSSFADHIIIADQGSTDGSLEIYKAFPNVRVVTNNESSHTNTVRWLLLDEARKIDGNNLIICIDADEMISRDAIAYIHTVIEKETAPIAFEFSWIQLWKKPSSYRVDGVWEDNRKPIAFLDNRQVNYKKIPVLNDHTPRVPEIEKKIFIREYPLLHFQHVAWDQTQMKQAWYRCRELLEGLDPRKINLKYSISLDTSSVMVKDTPPEWLKDLSVPQNLIFDISQSWHFKEIIKWWDEKSIEFFEPLEIWHIPVLRAEFVARMKREPKPKLFPQFLIILNNLKNHLLKKMS